MGIITNLFSIKNTGKHIIFSFGKLKLRVNFKRTFGFLNKLWIPFIQVKPNKIVFSNYAGKSYGCNSKYIAEEILNQNLPYDIVWLVSDVEKEKEHFPRQIRLVHYHSFVAFKELASAKVWVNNTRKNYFWECGLVKKNNQLYIQTWHGSLGIKKMEGDILNEDANWRRWSKVDSKNIDYILSNSKFDDEHYKAGFWYDGPIVRTGHPRNDVFFKNEDEKQLIKDRVYSALNIQKDAKIILYVPTFRDDGDVSCYDIDVEKFTAEMNKKFGGNCVFVTRLHPNVSPEKCALIKNENVVNANSYPDIQELLAASEFVVSDYSSCMFDFMLMTKPVFIYATDIDKYNTDRGFYYPLESTPFPIAVNNNELLENVLNFDKEAYIKKVEKFLIDFDCTDDGLASKNVVKIIKKFIDEDVKYYE